MTACQVLKNSIGQVDWHVYLEQEFRNPVYQPDDIHDHIFQYDLPIVATITVDTIYDRFLNRNYAGSVDIKRYHDDDIGRYVKSDAKSGLLIKVHGSIDNVENIVLTSNMDMLMRILNIQIFVIDYNSHNNIRR